MEGAHKCVSCFGDLQKSIKLIIVSDSFGFLTSDSVFL